MFIFNVLQPDLPHPKHGMGRAIFGLVMGLLGTGVIVAGVIGAVMSARH